MGLNGMLMCNILSWPVSEHNMSSPGSFLTWAASADQLQDCMWYCLIAVGVTGHQHHPERKFNFDHLNKWLSSTQRLRKTGVKGETLQQYDG